MDILNLFFGRKKEYIGLTSFKTQKNETKHEVKKDVEKEPLAKTSLTGILKRV